MKRRRKKKSRLLPALVLVLLIGVAVGVVAFGALRTRASAVNDRDAAILKLFTAPTPDPAEALGALTLPEPERQPSGEPGRLLLQAWQQVRACTPAGELTVEGDSAGQRYTLRTLDTGALTRDLTAAVLPELEAWVDKATQLSEVYGDDQTVRPELLQLAFLEKLPGLLSQSDYAVEQSFDLELRYADDVWTPVNRDEMDALLLGPMRDPDAAVTEILGAVAGELPYLSLHYRIDEYALSGPAPDESRFGASEDPYELAALLETEEAKRLIGDQELVWNPEIERLPDTPVRWYLDETILAIVWQEEEASAVGTFSEVFIADGSQLRRKISNDQLWDLHFQTTTSFDHAANAVLTLGGDFYYHGRACGIGVYQREIYRFEPYTCDNCYITSDGDMLFSYRGQWTDQAEVERFLEENDVLFSLCFGPVMIDDGVDVTPEQYTWGEVNDTYARSALGMLGKHHYLTMNINCGSGRYYNLATLRQEADAMLRRGCIKAYALDGGQTATTVFAGELINPVQFGWEKEISDVIYFATAVPEA